MKIQMYTPLILFLLICGGTVVAQEKKPEKKPPALPAGANVVIIDDGPQAGYISMAGRFKINFPGVPSESEENMETQIGTIVTHTTVLKGVVTYTAGYADYPLNLEQPQLVKQVLDGGRDEVLAQEAKDDPHVLSETDISFAGHPGRLLTIEYKSDVMVRSKTGLVGNRSYILSVASPKTPSAEREYEKVAAEFFDSVKLIPPLEADLAGTWKDYSSEPGRFRIKFPGTPYQMSSPSNDKVVHIAGYQSAGFYSVMYVELSEMMKDPASVKAFFDGVREGELKFTEKSGKTPKLLSETEITHNGYPGRLLVLEMPNTNIYRNKTFLVNNRVYTIMAAVPKDDAQSTTGNVYERLATKFLDSFQLLADPEKRP